MAMNGASSAVLGTDGHRLFCRREGVAYMEAFGPPLIFVTPNVADAQHPLLLIVQGQPVDLGCVDTEMEQALPKYRDMLRRLAQDPVGQVIQFEFLMRLFLRLSQLLPAKIPHVAHLCCKTSMLSNIDASRPGGIFSRIGS